MVHCVYHVYELTAICTWLLVVDCAAGTRIDGTLCIPCEQGSYQPLARRDFCTVCSQYTTTYTVGADSDTLCVGKYDHSSMSYQTREIKGKGF